jgi:hypothetical protein
LRFLQLASANRQSSIVIFRVKEHQIVLSGGKGIQPGKIVAQITL